jgi:N-acetylmuramic acid 6-phosphate etherase
MSKWSSLPTERINPRTLNIDRMSPAEIVGAMAREDRRVVAAVDRERLHIARGIDLLARALARGGRIIFIGAGTSGRLGVIEAAELPPTFGTSPDLVRALIAGGEGSVFRAREGAEDDFEDGRRVLTDAGVSSKDVVVGISASGVTEFVRGGLTAARRARATRILVTCWPKTGVQELVDLLIAPAVGPEVIAGSTRLKAGTATKMVLNMLTTGAMIRAGKTYGNLMVDVRTGSAKLKDRATRMVSLVTGVGPEDAERFLRDADWNVKAAIVMAKSGVPADVAARKLARAGGLMRRALGEDLAPVLKRTQRRRSQGRSNTPRRSN